MKNNMAWVLVELRKRGYVIKTNGAWHYGESGNQLELALTKGDKHEQ